MAQSFCTAPCLGVRPAPHGEELKAEMVAGEEAAVGKSAVSEEVGSLSLGVLGLGRGGCCKDCLGRSPVGSEM